jgi:uncharacterized protein (DUF342 family)
MTGTHILERKFGMLAIKKGIATKKQISRALKEQKHLAADGKYMFLGDILIRAEVISEKQRDALLESQKELKNKLTNIDKPEEDKKEEDLKGAKKIRNDSGYELTVAEDKMDAYLCPQQGPAPEVGLDSIKGLLEMEKISFGVVDDVQIIDYLASKPSIEAPWKIAQGKPVRPGRPPKIKYHFETDPLKAGTMDESGAIDFKDRGKIPQVEEGEIIAEIIPLKEGVPGTDIYGNPVPPPQYDEIIISCGIGVQRSEKDSLKFVAQTKGRPGILDNGSLCVSDVLAIAGDIGVETGHVEFDGHIEVAGSVLEGYRVKGKTLTADEIIRADVKIDGDIVVTKGIIGATILTDGTLKARHIRDAVIDSLGDINVETETYESKIETNGAFNIESGKILCSKVSAMRGINAAEIGSDGSVPCNLVVGIDNRMENKIARINLAISEKEKEQEVLKSQITELRHEEEALEGRIGELAQEEDKTTVKARSLNATLEKLKESNDRQNIVKVLQLMKHVNQELDQVKDKMGKLLEEQDWLENRIKDCKSQIKNSEAQIQEQQDDISSIIELAKMRKSFAIVNVSGTIYDRTSIQSPKASFVVKGNLQRVTIQEVKKAAAHADEKWKMIVSNLR